MGFRDSLHRAGLSIWHDQNTTMDADDVMALLAMAVALGFGGAVGSVRANVNNGGEVDALAIRICGRTMVINGGAQPIEGATFKSYFELDVAMVNTLLYFSLCFL